MTQTLETYLALPWTLRVRRRSDEGEYYVAEVEELPGLVATAETWEALAAAIDDALRSHISALLEAGIQVPHPAGQPTGPA